VALVDDLQELASRVSAGERRALAKAITLVESTRARDRVRAATLLGALPSGGAPSVRVAISGPPGVGKSTFIEAFGLHAIGQERRVAVLSIDPSSSLSGGSILGDKTRMYDLSRHRDAFIRPSPAGTTLGGVARRTRESMLLCEAAGYDLIIVETVGVGQSETAAAGMTDAFVVLLLPLGGDELQGIKRGIMELADIVLVNKADGDQRPAAARTVADYRSALRLLRPRSPLWTPIVDSCSALTLEGVSDAWTHVLAHHGVFVETGELTRTRSEQARKWLWEELTDQVTAWLRTDAAMAQALAACEAAVVRGELAPPAAAARILSNLSPIR
jgi:LAO/AO transport system kinase